MGARRPSAESIEITVSDLDAASLAHAVAILRWLVAKTASGWSHDAVDPAECARLAERFEAVDYEARQQLKISKSASVTMGDEDAVFLRRFAALAEVVDLDAFAELAGALRQLAATIEPFRQRPLQRARRSSLAEP